MQPTPGATIEDFDDDTEFDLPTISSGQPAPMAGGSEQAQMAAFQKMMEQMGRGPGASGDFGSTGMPPIAGAPQAAAAASTGNEEHKRWVSVYPIYFDAKKCYGKGCRRVSYEKASPFPTQLWIAKALARMSFKYVQEPYKTHPQDWENPGRVKVKLFGDDGKPLNDKVTNKKQLFDAIAEIIQPNCGGKPPALKPRVKRVKPAKVKQEAAPAPADGKKASKQPTAPALSIKQKQDLARARRDPNPNPIRERLAAIKFPPKLEDRLPQHSPAIEGGLLNMNLAEAMGGMPPGAGGMMDQLGPLSGMLGGMGLGGGDDDDDDDDDAAAAAVAAKKGNDKPMPALGRRQKKKVVRIGR